MRNPWIWAKRLLLYALSASLSITALTASIAANPSAASPIRVGYVESEEYYAFSESLAGIALGLQEIGVISGFHCAPDEPDAKKVWQALAASDGLGKVRFIPDMFFSMKSVHEAEYARFINSNQIDLLLVMGTVAGVYVGEHEEKNDYMVFAAANPIQSGIVKGETERCKPNSYAYIDPSRFRRQVDVAYNLFGFSKLGVVYEDTPNAYAYSGIAQMEQSAQANGFAIERCHVNESRNAGDSRRYYKELRDSYRELIDIGIDALYITTATTEDHMLPWLLEEVVAAGIPTISQVGESQVRSGVVLGVTLEDPRDQGRFVAARFAEYLAGTPVGELEQVYEIVPKVFLNYDTARETGLSLSFQTLLSADEIFRLEQGSAGAS